MFVIQDIPFVWAKGGPGRGPAVAGTLVSTAAASAMEIPLGVLGAIYLNEYGKTSRTAQLIRFMADVMTGVPSIVMGLFVYTLLVLRDASGFARGEPEEFAAAVDTLADAADYWKGEGRALLVVVELKTPALAPERMEISCPAT